MSIVQTGRIKYDDRIKDLMQKIKGKRASYYPTTVKLIEQIYRAIENHANGYWGEYGDWYKNLSDTEGDSTLLRNREVISKKLGTVYTEIKISNNLILKIDTWYPHKLKNNQTDINLYIDENGLIKEYFVLPEAEQKQQAADYANLINDWTIFETAREIPKDTAMQNAIIYLMTHAKLWGVIAEIYEIWNNPKLSKSDKDFYIETLVKGIAGSNIWSEESKLNSMEKLKFVFNKDRKIPLTKAAIKAFILEAATNRNVEKNETTILKPPSSEPFRLRWQN